MGRIKLIIIIVSSYPEQKGFHFLSKKINAACEFDNYSTLRNRIIFRDLRSKIDVEAVFIPSLPLKKPPQHLGIYE